MPKRYPQWLLTIRKTKTTTNRRLQELPADGGSCYRRVPATPITTSRIVAEQFDKKHKHVLETISELKAQMSTAAFSALFNTSTYTASNGKTNPMYTMTRDGF